MRIVEITEKFGVRKEELTGDKLSKETLKLIARKNQLRKETGGGDHIIETTEMRKLIRKKVKEAIKRYEDEMVRNPIKECRSTKKIKKALNTGKSLLVKLKDGNGN